MAFTNFTPAKSVMDRWQTITDAREYYGIAQVELAKVATELGDANLDDAGLLIEMSDPDCVVARDSVGLNPLRKGAVDLLFGSIKLELHIRTTIV